MDSAVVVAVQNQLPALVNHLLIISQIMKPKKISSKLPRTTSMKRSRSSTKPEHWPSVLDTVGGNPDAGGEDDSIRLSRTN